MNKFVKLLNEQTYIILLLLAGAFFFISLQVNDPFKTIALSLVTELLGAMIFKYLFDRFTEKEENKNKNFFDAGIVGLMPWLDHKVESKKAKKKVLLINYYIPEIEEVCRNLKNRILDNHIQEIEVFLVDNRKNSQGVSLLKNRSQTFNPSPRNIQEVSKNLMELCNLATEVRLRSNLRTFDVYLFNLVPTIAISQFNDKNAIISFYPYNQRAYNILQFVLDLGKDTDFVKHIDEHIQFLKNSVPKSETSYFNLLDDTQIERLKTQQKEII